MVPAPSLRLNVFSAQATRSTGATESKLKKAADEFESIFIAKLIHEMQASHLGPSLSGGVGSSVYRSLLDRQLAIKMASRDPFGIAKLLIEQLGGTPPNSDVSPAVNLGAPPALPVPPSPGSRQAVRVAGTETSSTFLLKQARGFAKRLMPSLVVAAGELGTSPRALLAQAALETGWGAHQPRTHGGAGSHNVFGVKAGSDWSGPVAKDATKEYINGRLVNKSADFRVYSDVKGAVKDFVNVVEQMTSTLPRVAHLGAKGWGLLMQRIGYATDPQYASKIEAVATSPVMHAALQSVTPSLK